MSRAKESTLALLVVAGLALLARVLVLPIATTDGGDAVYRTWAGWRWLSDPELITHGVWGPLHFYLIGATLAVAPDWVRAPVALHIGFGVLAAGLVYVFTKAEFSSSRAALLVAAMYALYPIAIRNSVSVRAETVFVVALLGAMLLLALARGERGRAMHAAGAGLLLTLGTMLRYEGWMLIPLLGVLLWRKPRFAALFGAVAMIHPIVWMAGNWIELGDPLHGINWASEWERVSMGRSDQGSASLALQAIAYPYHALRGMTVVAGLLAVCGALLALLARDRARIWLVPLAGLTTLLMISIARGTIVPKLNYTLTIGTMLLPFAAVVLRRLGIDTWSPRRCLAAALALLGTMAIITVAVSREGRRLGPVVERLAVSAVPRIENQAIALTLPPVIAAQLDGADEGLISDFYGWGATPYVELLTGVHPDRIFHAPFAPNQELDLERLAGFLDTYPEGVLVLLAGSRFAERLGTVAAGAAEVAGRGLALQLVRTIDWPATVNDRQDSALEIFRYRVDPP